MDLNPQGGRFTLWQVILIAACVAAAIGSGVWTVARTLVVDELEQCRRSGQSTVPEAIRKLPELSERLTLSVNERALLEEATKAQKVLKRESDELRAAQETARKELDARARSLEDALARVKQLEGDTFVLPTGKTRFVLGNEVALGVTGVDRSSGECMIQLGNREERLRPGKSVEESKLFRSVRLTLLEIIEDSCRFSLAR